jgi:hypothetical protein
MLDVGGRCIIVCYNALISLPLFSHPSYDLPSMNERMMSYYLRGA